MALHHKVLPPTIKVERPNPALEIERSPFHLSTEARPWVRDSRFPRRASVSSFGFGGSNFHVAMSEYVPVDDTSHRDPAAKLRAFDCELVTLSGECPRARLESAIVRGSRARSPDFCSGWRGRAKASSTRLHPAPRRSSRAMRPIWPQSSSRLRSSIESGPAQSFSTPTGIHFGTGQGPL